LKGLSTLVAGDVTVTVEHVLHGGGIRPHERVRSYDVPGTLALEVGATVLVSANRVCENDWGLWGSIIPVDASGALIRSANSPGRHAKWKSSGGSPPTLRGLQSLSPDLASRVPDVHFKKLNSLVLVEVLKKTPRTKQSFDVECRLLSRLVGPTMIEPTVLHFVTPEDGPCLGIGVGDSLIVPVQRADTGSELTFRTCPDYFRVQRGYLPGLGVALEKVTSRLVRSSGEYAIQSSVPGSGASHD
jgi:hypothetical protein